MERLSSIRRTTILGGGVSQNPCLAVFPLQIEFENTVDYSTVLYFEKNYQVLGDLKTTIPPYSRREKHSFTSTDNLFTFKMISAQNLIYKWSLYHKYDSGQQEFLQSFLTDFKTYLSDQVTSVRSSLMGTSIDALNLPTAIEKQLVAKFSNGMKLTFMFVAAEDLKTVGEIMKKKIKGLNSKQQNEVQAENTPQNSGPPQNAGNSEANIDVSSKVDTQQPPKDPQSNPETSNPPLKATPEQLKKDQPKQTPEPPLQPAKPQQQKIQDSTESKKGKEGALNKSLNIEKTTSLVDIDLLKLQSEKEAKVAEGQKKNEGQNLQIISEEPQKQRNAVENPYTPETPQPEQTEQPALEQPAPEPSKQVQSSNLNSTLNIQLDLKKVIILLLIVIISMMVMLWPKGKKQKVPKNRNKKSKKN